MHDTRSGVSVDAFNALDATEATTRLLTCLDVPRWAAEVANGRPYADLAELTARADAAAQLTDAELDSALARHPRIGEQAGAGHDVAFSESEQSGVDPGDAQVAAELAAGNASYERRFDRVFLIRAAGRSASEILAELRRRLGNDERTERSETAAQLREIAVLRLEKVI